VNGGLARLALVALPLASCAGRLPSVDEANAAVLVLRGWGSWAWAAGLVLIWADLLLPVPQTTIISAFGMIYGFVAGAVLGTVGLVTGGLLGYALVRSSARPLVVRLTGEDALRRMQGFFDRAGAWAVVLTRGLPYSVPEVLVLLAGLAHMPLRTFVAAMVLGSVPTGVVYAAIGAGWADRPVLALAASYVLPIVTLPLVLGILRRRQRKGDGMDLQGGCYCGALRYRATGDPIFKAQCHCRECQYVSGGHPNVVMGMPEGGFAWTKGTAKAFRRKDLPSPATREFCPECGTHVVARAPGVPGVVLLKVGTFDDPGVFGAPQMAIFTCDKQSFHHVPEGIPVFERTPG